MSIPFASGNTITQNYGERPEYYAQFKLAGHEGIDIVPVNAQDLTVQCVEEGVVVKDLDDPKSGAYGIYAVVWNRANQRAWWYCHLAENFVNANQTLKRGDRIGMMGNTGNTQGPHLHLGLTMTDANGARINLNNGYFGFVDPCPHSIN